ncbi:MAG: hypothetical protein N7Q72_00430, partial [Spiroplasma sp. Tabriz.8]|nr:hypothetical protein [Spiroplasma sp. Tabriz.8]
HLYKTYEKLFIHHIYIYIYIYIINKVIFFSFFLTKERILRSWNIHFSYFFSQLLSSILIHLYTQLINDH